MKGGHVLYRDVECCCRHQCLTSGWIQGSSDNYNNAYGELHSGGRIAQSAPKVPDYAVFGSEDAKLAHLCWGIGLAVWGIFGNPGSDVERTGGLLSYSF